MATRTRVVVFGGAGFIGHHVVQALSETYDVSVLDLVKPEQGVARAAYTVGSLSDATLVAATAAQCEVAVYLAGSSLPASSNKNIPEEVLAHLYPAVKTAGICAEQGVKRFIFASSGGTVYGHATGEARAESNPTSPVNAYGVSKLAAEHYLRLFAMHHDMSTVALRISNPFGPGQTTARGHGFVAAALSAALSGEELHIWGDGRNERDFIFVDDLAAAFLAAATYDGDHQVFNVGAGESRSLNDVVSDVEAVTNRKVALRYTDARKADVDRALLDISLAKKELRWSPSTSFREGVKFTADWWAGVLKRRA